MLRLNPQDEESREGKLYRNCDLIQRQFRLTGAVFTGKLVLGNPHDACVTKRETLLRLQQNQPTRAEHTQLLQCVGLYTGCHCRANNTTD